MCISAACCERQSAFSQTQTHSHHRLILKGRTQSSPTGYLERSEIAVTRLFRNHDDWARATDTQSRLSVPFHGEEPYGKEFRQWQHKPIKDPSRQDPASSKHSPPNGKRWRAVLQEPVSCNAGENIPLDSRRKNSSGLIRSRF